MRDEIPPARSRLPASIELTRSSKDIQPLDPPKETTVPAPKAFKREGILLVKL